MSHLLTEEQVFTIAKERHPFSSTPQELIEDLLGEEHQAHIAAGWISPTELAKEKFKAGCEGRQEGESAMVAKFQDWVSPEEAQEILQKIESLRLFVGMKAEEVKAEQVQEIFNWIETKCKYDYSRHVWLVGGKEYQALKLQMGGDRINEKA